MSPSTVEVEPIASPTGVQQVDRVLENLIRAFAESPPDALPARMLFGELLDPRLRVTRAIPVEVTREDASVVVSWNETGEFGCGQNLSGALEDLASSIRELFYSLRGESTLGSDLLRIRSKLSEHVSLVRD